MKYLDASWFLEMLPTDKADDELIMPLIGFYYCCCACKDLLAQEETEHQKENIQLAKDRKILPLALSAIIDSKLVDEQFNSKGMKFSEVYLEKKYFDDFIKAFNEITLETYIFDVPNTWENYDKPEKLIDNKFYKWESGKDINKPWWKIWG